jgi:hypothetical protein
MVMKEFVVAAVHVHVLADAVTSRLKSPPAAGTVPVAGVKV